MGGSGEFQQSGGYEPATLTKELRIGSRNRLGGQRKGGAWSTVAAVEVSKTSWTWGCALKAEPTGFPAGLDMVCEGKRGGKDDIKAFGLGSWKFGWAPCGHRLVALAVS